VQAGVGVHSPLIQKQGRKLSPPAHSVTHSQRCRQSHQL
jgi:hypothetical protein